MSVFDTILEFAPAVGLTTAGVMTGNPALIGAGVGSGIGAVKGREARSQREAGIKAEAIKTKYSPFTGQQGDISRVPQANVFSDILGGGLQGAAIGSMFGGAGAKVAEEGATLGGGEVTAQTLGETIPSRAVTSGVPISQAAPIASTAAQAPIASQAGAPYNPFESLLSDISSAAKRKPAPVDTNKFANILGAL